MAASLSQQPWFTKVAIPEIPISRSRSPKIKVKTAISGISHPCRSYSEFPSPSKFPRLIDPAKRRRNKEISDEGHFVNRKIASRWTAGEREGAKRIHARETAGGRKAREFSPSATHRGLYREADFHSSDVFLGDRFQSRWSAVDAIINLLQLLTVLAPTSRERTGISKCCFSKFYTNTFIYTYIYIFIGKQISLLYLKNDTIEKIKLISYKKKRKN